MSRPGQTFATDLRVLNGAGQTQWLGARMVNLVDDPDVGGVVVNLHDITARKDVEAALTHQAFHDGLTDLANRALFIDRVEHTLHRNARTAARRRRAVPGPRRFQVRQRQFRPRGRRCVLLKMSERLRLVSTSGRGHCRALGGDEFAVSSSSRSATHSSEAEIVAERILVAVDEPSIVARQRSSVTGSASVIASRSVERLTATADVIVGDADVAMYRAKSSGKACIEFVYDPEMRSGGPWNACTLESDLRTGALEMTSSSS